MIKKAYPAIFLLFLANLMQAGAYSISDPNDQLYTLISGWEERGYIRHPPLVRPYPPQLVYHYLEEVIAKGSASDRELALSVREQLEGKRSLIGHEDPESRIALDLDLYGELLVSQRKGESFLRPALEANIGGNFTDLLAYSGTLGLFMNAKDDALFTPYKLEPENFYQSGGGAIAGGSITEHFWQGGLFIGSEKLYFQAGMMRSSFGPFFDNGAVLGPQAPEAGHFSLTYNGSWLTISTLLLQLVATTAFGPSGNPTGPNPSLVVPEKYLVIHSIDLHPSDWLSFGLIQTVVYGGRFDPLYLIPFQVLAGAQTFTGDYDNSLVGLYTRLRPLRNLSFNMLLYLDDLHLNKMFKLNFSSNQNKLAFQVGAAWVPELPLFLRLSLDYLLVTPYMYTHGSVHPINYLTYTHQGRHLGSVLDPNSDQLTMKASLILNERIQAEIWGRYSRHGNHSEADVDSQWAGTIWDDGYDNNTQSVTFYGPSTFLAQSVLEKIFQLGLGLDFALPVAFLDILLETEYVFEVIQNRRFIDGALETNHYLKLLLGLRL